MSQGKELEQVWKKKRKKKHIKIDEFHEHLNKQNTSFQFTKEIKENSVVETILL